MMRAPTLYAIRAAEQRLLQSKRDTRASLGRARIAFRAFLVQPASIAAVAGAAGLVAFWLARRPARVNTGVNRAKTSSALVLLRTFCMRYAMQALPFILQQFRAAGQDRAARDNRDADAAFATGQVNGIRS